MRARRRPVVAAAFAAVTLLAVAALDLTVDPPPAPAVATGTPAGVPAVSGTAVCAVGSGREGTATTVTVVHPGQAEDPPATVEATTIGGRRPFELVSSRLFPGAAARGVIELGNPLAATVRWSSTPVATTRAWRLEGDEVTPAGTAAGPCVASTATDAWTIPGMTTAGGGQARLRLANPHRASATVAVGFLTPRGAEEPTRLRNLSVAPGTTMEIDLNEYVPEQEDLAAVVDVLAGRVAVEGYQLVLGEIGGIDGVSLLAASPEAAESWTVPWIVDGEDRASWLWIANRTDRTAPVELTIHTDDGGVVAAGLSEVSVPPRTVRRVDLRGTLPEGVSSAAVTARSDGVPVTVSGVVELRSETVARTGFAVQLGAPALDAIWTVAGGTIDGRQEQLRLVNPGSEAATVAVTLWNGATVTKPGDLAAVRVPPGGILRIDLAERLAGATSWAATVRAVSGGLVVGQVGNNESGAPARHVVAALGVPSAWWRTTVDSPPVRSAPGTAQRLGTELGIEPIDPFAPAPTSGREPTSDPSPTPDPTPDPDTTPEPDPGTGDADGGGVDPAEAGPASS